MKYSEVADFIGLEIRGTNASLLKFWTFFKKNKVYILCLQKKKPTCMTIEGCSEVEASKLLFQSKVCYHERQNNSTCRHAGTSRWLMKLTWDGAGILFPPSASLAQAVTVAQSQGSPPPPPTAPHWSREMGGGTLVHSSPAFPACQSDLPTLLLCRDEEVRQ